MFFSAKSLPVLTTPPPSSLHCGAASAPGSRWPVSSPRMAILRTFSSFARLRNWDAFRARYSIPPECPLKKIY